MPLKVVIVGAGIGGLCLAQGLRKSGVDVEIFERDPNAFSRGQGYRFRVDADGDSALKSCLSANLYALYRATANQSVSVPIGAYDCQLNLIYRHPTGASQGNGHVAVNRLTLREILLAELEGIVHFGHEFVSFEQRADVHATFANGTVVKADLLVAADGIHSIVRRQLLPEAKILDTGMECIYGKTPLNDDILSWLPESLFSGFTPVLGPDRRTLAFGMYRPHRPIEEAARESAPGSRFTAVGDYLMWMLVYPSGHLINSGRSEGNAICASTLHNRVLAETSDWHPALRRLIELADIDSTFPVAIRTSHAIKPWNASRVTVLGDAIHPMTPAGGIGANTALRDAALLTESLSDISRNRRDLIAAIASYESQMRDYGFAAVQSSLSAASQLYRMDVPGQEKQL